MMTIKDLKSQNLLLFEVISGSRAFGLATEKSDTDLRGIYYLPKEKFFGLDYIPQVANETNDEVYYEIGRFVELLQKNNPNILEILATPEDCILYKHPVMEHLKLENFLSKLCKDTFAGYAITQIRKAQGLKKKMVNPIPKERKTVLDFCYVLEEYDSIPVQLWLEKNNFKQENCGLINIPHSKGVFALFHGENLGYKGIFRNEDNNEVLLSSIPKGEKVKAYLSFNQDGYSTYCKEYREYWDWVEKRNAERYNTNQEHGKNYDSKNMMHTIRLLQTAKQILSEGKLEIRVKNREELLQIKSGKLEYDELIVKAESLILDIEKYYQSSTLLDYPDKHKTEKVLIKIREELYQ